MAVDWISGAIKHPGSLRKELKVPDGKNIPMSKLDKAADSKNPEERKRATLAKTLREFHK